VHRKESQKTILAEHVMLGGAFAGNQSQFGESDTTAPDPNIGPENGEERSGCCGRRFFLWVKQK
jgi:hypothetical protein